MNPEHFLQYIVVDALRILGAYDQRMSTSAGIALVLGTAMVESDLKYLQQLKGGPAIGVFQMEPATHLSIWQDFLPDFPELSDLVEQTALTWSLDERPDPSEMRWNLRYATVMCRIRYWWAKEKLPDLDAYALAGYHERHYNTATGALGRTPELEAVPIFKRAIGYVEKL